MTRFLMSWILSGAALAAAAGLLGEHMNIGNAGDTTQERLIALAIVALVFSLINTFVAPVVKTLSLPFIVITFLMSRWAGGLVTRYGAKLPLIIGPSIAAVGFVLFAVPGTEGSYWTTFFPAVVVQGLGMSLVIAPLTTTALNAVEGRHSGLASGVNNAVSRTAGLLSIAVLGIFVFASFSSGLDSRTESVDLTQEQRAALESEKVDLGGAEAPEGVDAGTAASIERAVDESFVGAFRLSMYIAAGLAVASALAAAVLIEGKGSVARPEEAEPGREPGEARGASAPA